MFAIAASLAIAVTAVACPSGHPLYGDHWWTPICTSPTIVVAGDATDNTYFVGNNIFIEATAGAPGVAFIQIFGAQNGLDVGDITVSSTAPITAILSFQSSIRNVASIRIAEAAGNSLNDLWIEGRITGDLGNVVATGIGIDPNGTGFRVGDDLNGSIDLVDTGAAPELRIGSLTIDGDIAPNISINTESGGIGSIVVDGVIGADGNPVLIHSGRDITKITAGEMHVNIVAGWNDPNDDPDMGTEWANVEQIQTLIDTGNEQEYTGDFVGTIYANTIGEPVKRLGDPEGPLSIPQIEVQGDFQGILGFESPLVPHHTFVGSQIVVGGAFKSGSVISVPAGGLEGQIVFNRDNIDAPWQSNARVEVGAVNLTTTQYNPSAASLGGGAAGLAEFRLHHAACQPPDVFGNPPVNQPGVVVVPTDLVMAPDGLSWECVPQKPSVVIQFYGPVAIDDEYEESAVKVHRYSGGGWTPVTPSFDYAASAGGDAKRVSITPKTGWVAGSYRVTREPGALNSLEVADVAPGTTAGVNAFTYYFDVVIDACEGELLAGFDLNSDQSVSEPGDMPAWLVGPVDYNNDAATDSADVRLLQSAAAMYGALPGAPEYFPGPFVEVE